MRCPRCGNEVSLDEAFCGQCGAPNSPPAKPTAMASAPPLPNGPQGGYPANAPVPPQGAPRTRQLSREGIIPGTSYPTLPSQVGVGPVNPSGPAGPNRQTGFYHDATEAMSSLPGQAPGLPPQQRPFQQSIPVGQSYHPGYTAGSAQYGPVPQQSYPTNQYAANPMYIQPPLGGTGQAFTYAQANQGRVAPQKRHSSGMLLLVSLCIIVALVSVAGLGALFVMKGRAANEGGNQPGNSISMATATPVSPTPTPSLVPTATPSPTPQVTPSPTAAPTPAPDAGFQWCADACTTIGYQIEYPAPWSPGATPNVPGYQFTNPTDAEQVAIVKVPGPTQSQPGDLLTADFQANYQSQPGYMPPTTPATTTTIGGTIWLTQVAYYQDQAQQQIRVTAFATVYQQKAYIIELQANNAQFDAINQQTFALMLKSFSFQAIPTA